MAHARPTRSLANRLGRTAAETPNLLDPLEPRTLLSDWWIAGSIGGADWVGGLGGGFSGYGLAISGAYGDGDWYVEGSYSSGPVDVVVGASGSGESGQVAGEAQGQLRAPAGVAEIGAQLAVEWTPDGGGAKVDVWRIGPGGWHKEDRKSVV